MYGQIPLDVQINDKYKVVYTKNNSKFLNIFSDSYTRNLLEMQERSE